MHSCLTECFNYRLIGDYGVVGTVNKNEVEKLRERERAKNFIDKIKKIPSRIV